MKKARKIIPFKTKQASAKIELSKFIYFLVSLSFFLWVNFYFSELIVSKVLEEQNLSNDFLNFVYVKNTGAAFSIMQSSTNVLIIFSLLSVAFIFYFVAKNLSSMKMKSLFCVALLTSGILGNLYERIHFGYVRDFFDLAFVNFPVFNISDIFINVGVFGIIILLLLTKKNIKIL